MGELLKERMKQIVTKRQGDHAEIAAEKQVWPDRSASGHVCFAGHGGFVSHCRCIAPDTRTGWVRRLYLGYSRGTFVRPQIHRLSFTTDLKEKEVYLAAKPGCTMPLSV
jgi:hypothetical protein